MFDMQSMEQRLFHSMRDSLSSAFDKSGIKISREVADALQDMLRELFASDPQGLAGGGSKKSRKGSGDTYSRGLFNVIPSTNATDHITDTLVVYCTGSDNLYDRLVDTIIEVSKHNFRNVIFFTTKWDTAVITGKNIKRLQDLIDLNQSGTAFCFILVSISEISMIPII